MAFNKFIWQKYLNGTATEEELQELYTSLQSEATPELEELFRKDMEGNEQLSVLAEKRLLAAIRQQIMSRPATAHKRGTWKKWTAAAAVLLCVVAGYYFLNRHSSPDRDTLAGNLYDSIVNNSGNPRIVHLPDQTKVWLNTNATLYISQGYEKQRQVQLKGEAYFDVVKDASHPFTVQTGELITTVLGTAFNIEQVAGDEIRVSLLRGKVKTSYLNDTTRTLTLSPGEMAVANRHQRQLLPGTIGVPDAAAWIRGDLVFNQLPLQEALQKWAAYYGKKIEADRSITAGRYVTGTFHRTQQWEEVLRHLLFVHQLQYKEQSNTILIKRQ